MDESLDALTAIKEPFLDIVASDINSYIVGQGHHCIDVIEKTAEDDDLVYRTHRASLNSDFCEVLYRFVRRKPHNGHILDSALTMPVCEIVSRRYEEFYQANADTVSAGVLAALTKDNLILDSFLNRVIDKALDKASSEVRKRVVHLIVHQIHSSTKDGALHAVGHQIGHVAATTAGSQVAVLVAHVLVKMLAGHIAVLVARILSSGLIKKLVLLVVKKVTIAAVGGIVIKFLAAHVAAAVGGTTIMWIALPLMVTYLCYKIATFPEKLGKEVSKSVRRELSERFTSMNKTILDKIFEQVVDDDKLVSALAGDKELKGILKSLAEKAMDGPGEPDTGVTADQPPNFWELRYWGIL